MKNYKRIALSVFVVALVLSVAVNAFSWNEVKKAREFMQAGMYPQAIELLGKRINDKPSDGDAHFQLGVCFIHTKNYRGADERFSSAVRLKSDFGYKIGGQYQKAGTEKLNNGQTQSAINLFNKAVKYQPSLKKQIATQCKTKGLTYLEKNKAKEAIMLLTEAAAHQPQLKEEIAKILFDKGSKYLFNGGISTALLYYNASTTLNRKYKPMIRQAFISCVNQEKFSPNKQIYLLHLAVQQSNADNKQEIISILKTLGQKFNEKKILQENVKTELNRLPSKYRAMLIKIAWPPDFKVYHPGDILYFKEKKGTYSEHWIDPSYGTTSIFQIASGEYEIVTRGGRRYKMDNIPSQLLDEYKMHALTDCSARILFK